MIEVLKKTLGAEAEKLQHELNVILPAEIRKAVEHGDLRENSEYKAALERQQFVQARLGQLRQRLSKLSSIDIAQIPSDKVGLGSEVIVEDEKKLLALAVKSTSFLYLTNPQKPTTSFRFGCPVPARVQAFTFKGGGAALPKRPESCDSVILMISAAGSVTQLITHYPSTRALIMAAPKLT